MLIIYNIVFYFVQPLIWLYLLFRSYKIPAYRYRWIERYGFCKNKVATGGILLHSVSVGETLTAVPLVKALRNLYPSLPITVTTITPTGSELVISSFNKDVYHVYLPYDLPFAMNRFIDNICPKLVIIMETELWPNMISAMYKRKIPLIIANARLSESSMRGYIRLGKFINYILSKVSLVAAQNEEYALNFKSLGLKDSQLAIMGNLKFDFSINPKLFSKIACLQRQWALRRQVWIASSTHDGEERIILKAHRKLLKIFPDLLLILVPRHPERFKYVTEMVKKLGFSFTVRSAGEIPLISTKVVIGDTMGELVLMYGIADLAFVGGSLVKKGGHNPLEPAAHSIPILMGPHTFNFKDICIKLQQAGGLITVFDTDSLVKAIYNLLINEDYRLQYGKNSIKVLNQNKGALYCLLDLIHPYIS